MQGDDTQIRCGVIDGFQIGDFVWSKLHGQSWWPGQVCNPLEEPESARFSDHPDGHVLVTYFGDNTFSWCESSLLKPFKEEFRQMVERNNSQSFMDALKEAMFEVERCLRSNMTCYCVPPEKVVQFGIRQKNDIGNASISNYSPSTFLNHLQDVAQDVSVANMLEVALLRSWAASFYLRNGCFVKMIEDLFDEKQTDLITVPDNLHKDKDGEVQMNGGRTGKGPHISQDEASRKKRSIAELILLADPEPLQESVTEEDKLGDFEDEIKVNLKKKKRDKQKDKVFDVELSNDKHEEENGLTRRERKKSKYLSPPYTSMYKDRSNSFKLVDLEGSENDSEVLQNLQTKLPTYIDGQVGSLMEAGSVINSPAYNEASTHDLLVKLLSTASNVLHLRRNPPLDTMTEYFAKHRSFAYSGIIEPESLSKQHDEPGTALSPSSHEKVTDVNKVATRRTRNSRKNESKHENVKQHESASETPKSNCSSLNGVEASQTRLRHRAKSEAGKAVSLTVEKLGHAVINSLEEGKMEDRRNKNRGVVKDGNAEQSGNEVVNCPSQKRKNNVDTANGDHKLDFDHIMYDNSGETFVESKRTRLVENNNENSVALLLTFSLGSTLPSKDELLLSFGKYGALINHETELFRDPGCARVVFARATDAKKALNDIKKSSNNNSSTFPFSVVDCQSFELPRSPEVLSRSESDPNAELKCISQDLQRMVGTLTPKKGLGSRGLKMEVRKDLVKDIKNLLNKVNKLIA